MMGTTALGHPCCLGFSSLYDHDCLYCDCLSLCDLAGGPMVECVDGTGVQQVFQLHLLQSWLNPGYSGLCVLIACYFV